MTDSKEEITETLLHQDQEEGVQVQPKTVKMAPPDMAEKESN